jgi:hypothetical protein
MRSGEYDLIASAAVGEQMTCERSTPYMCDLIEIDRRREDRYEALGRYGGKEGCTGVANGQSAKIRKNKVYGTHSSAPPKTPTRPTKWLN